MFALLAAIVLAIGAGFALAGAWLVLPFAGLEVGALAAAFIVYARRAADYERIELQSGRLTVEVNEALRSAWYEFEAWHARVSLEEERVMLKGAGTVLELGRHLDRESRRDFAMQLRRRLRT